MKGIAPANNFYEGMTCRFFGVWEPPHPQYGKTFSFSSFCQAEPVSRRGLIKYLEKNAANIGPAIASRLFDQYAGAACRVLRTDPERVAREIQGLNLERAREAAASLAEKAKFEDTRIALTNLLDGRGFQASIYEKIIARFGVMAPDRIRRDPFCLLVEGFPGAGFKRCDRMYGEFGLPLGKIKRQV
ncbi:MAG: hypothetical protein NT069_07675, partial [Planctomycetota bacterium]|nr:hypothetical protein [Planctomycetota bacterium]